MAIDSRSQREQLGPGLTRWERREARGFRSGRLTERAKMPAFPGTGVFSCVCASQRAAHLWRCFAASPEMILFFLCPLRRCPVGGQHRNVPPSLLRHCVNSTVSFSASGLKRVMTVLASIGFVLTIILCLGAFTAACLSQERRGGTLYYGNTS